MIRFRTTLCALVVTLAWASISAQSIDQASPQGARNDALEQALKRAAASNPQTPTSDAGTILRKLPATSQNASLGAWATNRSAKLTVHSLSVRPTYGAAAPSAGGTLLVLDVEWENIIPLTFIYERQVPTAYQVPSLADHLYLVVNGRTAARLRPEADSLPGHVPVKDFKLDRIGATVRGNLLFEIPAEEVRTLELRFYDYAHGHFGIPVLEAEPGLIARLAAEKPQAPAAGNDVLEAGVFGLEKRAEVGGRKAPEGMTWLVADLRAHSKFTYDADATAFDPQAKAGERTQVGTVADWTDAYQNIQLVLDGEHAYPPVRELCDLPDQPRFLPDIMTGGRLVFLVPQQFTSAELHAEMPNTRTPAGEVIRPKGLTLALEGTRPGALPEKTAVASVDDDVFKVAITGKSAPEAFAGAAPQAGRRWLVLDVTISNANPSSAETFQTHEQLKVADAAGQLTSMDEVAFAGPRPPTKLLLIPPGERRSFQVAYQIPAGLTQPRLAYSGVSKAEMVGLGQLPASGGVAAGGGGEAMAEAQRPEGTQPTAGAPRQPAQPGDGGTDRPAVAPGAGADPSREALKPLKVGDREFPARVAARPALKARGLAAQNLTAEQVNQSIDRGAAALWRMMKRDLDDHNQVIGARREHVLMLLALVHAGTHEKDSEIDATIRRFLASVDPNQTDETYQNALLCMLVDAYGDPTYLSKARAAAQWFVDSQGADGTWSYGPAMDIAPKDAGPPQRRPLMVAGGEDPAAQAAPLARLAPAEAGKDGDNSTTQYALLGLHAAGRAGVKVPAEVWQRAAAGVRKRQHADDGGWAYVTGHSYGSMTCAGICSLALAAYEMGEDSASAIEVERGLAWLNAHFQVEQHPVDHLQSYLYYYLYALERVGRILDTEFIGEHEWYPRGARFLVDQQLPDGAWDNLQGSELPEHATSFAMLFLTRATPSLKPEPRTGPGRLITAVELPPGLRLHVILDCSGSMLEEMDGRPKFDIARDAVETLIRGLPAGSEVALQAYGHRLRAVEPNADTDTEVVRSMLALGDEQARDELLGTIASLRARGKTPLAASLEMAGGAVGSSSEQRPITVVLLTDGGEDTFPRRDPVEAARRLVERPGVRLHVIGFDVDRSEWIQQLQDMASAGGGSYLAAAGAETLARELSSVVLGKPEAFAVIDESGKQVAEGAFGRFAELPPGKYRLRATYSGHLFEQDFSIQPGLPTTVTFDARTAAEAIAAGQTEAVAATPLTPAAGATTAPAEARRFCTSCGQQANAGARFCTRCGTRL